MPVTLEIPATEASRLAALRRRTLQVLEVAAPGDVLSRRFDLAIVWLIALNVLAMVIETLPGVGSAYGGFFGAFEIFSVVIFTGEYMLRLWSAKEDPRYSGRAGRARFAATPMALVDLLAVLPFWLPFLGVDLRVLRSLRLFRVFRIAKLSRYSAALQMMGRVAVAKKEELVVTASLGAALLLLASSLIYFAENAAQPEVFSSIPAAMWWGVATLTTVGYGDAVPVTAAGQILASAIAILGIGMFALPTGILGAALVEEMQHREHPAECPHCGGNL